MVQVDCEIVPAERLGGLELRVPISHYENLILWPEKGQCICFMTSAYEARYALDGGIVQIAIDVRNGKVFKLIAGDGYKGKLFGRIAVGMPVAEALAADDRMYYDEAAELLLIRGVDGVALEVPLDDPTSEEAVVSHISAISVFVPEIETLAGIEGRW